MAKNNSDFIEPVPPGGPHALLELKLSWRRTWTLEITKSLTDTPNFSETTGLKETLL